MTRLAHRARAFINEFQGGFPIVGRPFRGVAARLGMTEADLIQTVRQLLQQGLLSRFGPMYDAARLGGGVTLAALSVPEPEFARVADLVNALPAVAHNYRREHRLNMWFVVASERREGVDECLATISRVTGLEVYDLPKLREFYLGLWLRLDDQGGVDTVPVPPAGPVLEAFDLSPEYQRIVTATQAGLPVVADPYAQLAAELDIAVDALHEALTQMLSSGVIRRIGAVPNHYRLGLRGNGMTVWDVPDERVAELGERIGRLDCVSHCYERPRHPGVWSYNLFAMVHGHDRAEVLDKTKRLQRVLGDDVNGHDVLFSSAVLKKTGLRLAA
jgi:DNA-binding Lrp family transcriptional regulator